MEPTEKQISFILRLINGRREDDAYREIAKDMRVSLTAARKRATKQDASDTISRLQNKR